MNSDPLALQAERSILLIRQRRVMLDYDLAALYGVEARALNQAVKRNLARFPADFMFQLTPAEAAKLRRLALPSVASLLGCPSNSSQTVMSSRKYDSQFKVVFDAIRQLMAPPPAPVKKEIGFHVKEDAAPYRIARSPRRGSRQTTPP